MGGIEIQNRFLFYSASRRQFLWVFNCLHQLTRDSFLLETIFLVLASAQVDNVGVWLKKSIYLWDHTHSLWAQKKGLWRTLHKYPKPEKNRWRKKRARCKARKQITIEQWGWKWKWIKKKIEHTISVSTLLLIHHFLLWSVCRMNG